MLLEQEGINHKRGENMNLKGWPFDPLDGEVTPNGGYEGPGPGTPD